MSALVWAQAPEPAPDAATQIILRGLTVSPMLRPVTVPDSELPVYLGAEAMQSDDERNLTLDGQGVVRRADGVLSGDFLYYKQNTEDVTAIGNARLVQDGNIVIGPSMRYNLDTDVGDVDFPQFWLDNGGAGVGTKAVMTNRNEMTITDVTYSGCPCPDPAWYIKSSKVDLNYDENEGVARNGVLFFKGVPLLASPYLTFPLRPERKSGFLLPTFATTNQTGFDLTLPYYLNLAPNYDATLVARPMSKRGLMLGGEFRYLSPSSSGQFAGTYLNRDSELGTDRWLYSLQHNQSFGSGFTGGWNVSGVSDDDYFKDFSLLAINEATTTYLPRSVFAGWSNRDWQANVQYTTFQTLGDIVPQYNLVPGITLNGARFDQNGFDLKSENAAVWFDRPTDRQGQQFGPDGQRYVSYNSVSFPMVRPGWYITPKVGLHTTRYETEWYRLSGVGGRESSNNRVLPITSVDAGMTFERPTSFFGLDAIQTLEPRIYYLNVPYRDQSNLPVYDTTLSDFSFSQAFQENIYTGGWDRIANANQLTLALGSRLLDEETGFERAAFAVGQRIYFVDQLVTLPGETPRSDVRSEFLINASAELTDTLSATIDLQYNPYDGSWDRAQIVGRFNPKRAATLSASYRYQRNPTGAFQPQGQEQIGLAFQWPLSANIYSVGRVDYSLLNIPARNVVPRVTQAIAGLEYKGDCCWAARVVYQRYAIDPSEVNDAIFFQLELSGLGGLGQDPMGLLRSSIPNFQNITPAIKPVGKFERYE
uniref:LPS-assembly protein LptD n=1 Tax=Orrella sp. TaxID=1921583 RepID=UPI004048E8FE